MKLVVLALLLGACAGSAKPGPATTTAPQHGKPLYDRLGGMDRIDAIVKDFVEVQIAQDDRIRDRFKDTDRAHFQTMLADQICEASGGPCKYSGKTMHEAHAGLGIGEAEFRVFLDDLRKSLHALQVPEHEQDEVLAALAISKSEIVDAQ